MENIIEDLKSWKRATGKVLKEHGFFDGRFRSKVVADKKKKQSKDECRNFKYMY
jgi:hypothetical protein